jgi:hypothetical protein
MVNTHQDQHIGCSLRGPYKTTHETKFGKIKAENKCKFFLLWLLLQRKLLTADRIIKRGGQANPVCQLCRTSNESMTHMVTNCYYSKRVWQLIEQQAGQQNTHPQQPVSNLNSWVRYHSIRNTEIRLSPTRHVTFGKNGVAEFTIIRRWRKHSWRPWYGRKWRRSGKPRRRWTSSS